MSEENIIDKIKSMLDTQANQPIDRDLLQLFATRYPAFQLPAILALRHPHSDIDEPTTARMIESLALSLPDPKRVRILLDPEGTGRYDKFYPVQQVAASPSTDDAIDTFLSTYGNIDPAEEALLNRMIFNPVPDYAATLERETPTTAPPADEQDRLLDAFIAKNNDLNPRPTTDEQIATDDTPHEVGEHEGSSITREPVSEDTESREPSSAFIHKAPTGSLLSESLAKIFIKQHNYKRAYEIISSLSLNYPEKSVYFADQLRFLRKLIANQEARERQKQIKKQN
ncbi:MAG: hypothetical protein NC082_03315 [Clostridiales bacterium]|nr:hypothetical protein [Clostridiales bacterium]